MLSFSRLILVIAILLSGFSMTAQTYGLMTPQNPIMGAECQQCREAFKQKPKEVRFVIKVNNQEDLYFEITHKEWLKLLFKDSNDGFLIDIISKDKYNCSLETISRGQNNIQGTSLKPVFKEQILSGLTKHTNGTYRIKIGTIPEKLKNQELEFNIFFINDNYLCRYNKIYNLKSYALELLDMGMYLDSITYQSNILKPTELNGYQTKYKTLQFKIPFEKDMAEYSMEDIKPVYDSLKLSTFNIKKINIKAYSSVEGSLERNLELQSQRAQSIAVAMQQFQTPVIETNISATENWVEFLNDLKKTKYTPLASLSQTEIKNKLQQADINEALEPYLKNHRKAIITLELDKKNPYKEMLPEQLFNLFKENITSKNIKEANAIQNAIFERIKRNEISPDKIVELNVPKQKEYVGLIAKNSSLSYLLDARQGMITYNQLLELDKLTPNNKKIKYNLCAVKFIIWRYNWQPIDTDELKQEIFALKNLGVSQVLIDRMLINFELLKAESFMSKGDFKSKDKSTEYIYTKYKNKLTRDEDFLNLANYFSRFANHKYSKELLQNKVQDIEVSEDLLFYYLNLTIVDKQLNQKEAYRIMMLNANDKNPKRFCELFNSIEYGGITFQLLENDFLRKMYCENCPQ